VSIRGRVNCLIGAWVSKEVGLLVMVAMVTDSPAIARDMSAIASSRRSAACKTMERDAWSQGLRILERCGVRRKSRVGRGCDVVLYGGIVSAAALSLAMVAIGCGVIINKVVASSSSSEVGVIGVGAGIEEGVSGRMSSRKCSEVLTRLGMCCCTLVVVLVSGFMAGDCD